MVVVLVFKNCYNLPKIGFEHVWPSGRRQQTHNLFSNRTSQVQILLHAYTI